MTISPGRPGQIEKWPYIFGLVFRDLASGHTGVGYFIYTLYIYKVKQNKHKILADNLLLLFSRHLIGRKRH